MMKKFLLAGACLAALTGPAFATTWAECNKYQEPYWVQIRPLLGKLAMQEGASPQAKCSPETIAMARKAASLIAAAEATPVVKGCYSSPSEAAKNRTSLSNLQSYAAACGRIASTPQHKEVTPTQPQQKNDRSGSSSSGTGGSTAANPRALPRRPHGTTSATGSPRTPRA